MLFAWRFADLHTALSQTNTHAVYRRLVIHRQEAEMYNNTNTHSLKQRAHSVWWKNELPLLFYQDESSDGNQ